MPPNYGTRQRANSQFERVAQGHPNGGITRDVGMSKNVTADMTFVAGEEVLGAFVLFPNGARPTAANGTFAAFAVDDPIEITGTPINLGFFTVIGIDTVNASYLILDPPAVAGGPYETTIRTP